MKTRKIMILAIAFLSLVAIPLSVVSSTFAAWAVTDNANDFSLTITPYAPGKATVNYYLPSIDGSTFQLHSTETVNVGATLSNVPTPGSISNYTFEKWSTSSSFSDSFNTGSTISESVDLYAGYYGYSAKGSSDSSYKALPANSGTVKKMKFDTTNSTTDFSYTYALLGRDIREDGIRYISSDRFQGNSIGVYKHYLASSVYTLVESRSNKLTDGYYKVYFNPNGTANNKIYFARTFVFELKNFDGWVSMYMWDSSNGSIKNEWPGSGMTWIGGGGENYYQRYYAFDIDTSVVDSFIAAGGYSGQSQTKQTENLAFPTGVNNAYYAREYSYDTGWYDFSTKPSSDIYGS